MKQRKNCDGSIVAREIAKWIADPENSNIPATTMSWAMAEAAIRKAEQSK